MGHLPPFLRLQAEPVPNHAVNTALQTMGIEVLAYSQRFVAEQHISLVKGVSSQLLLVGQEDL